MATVKLTNVKKIYDKNVVAVQDFNLEIADKEFVVFVGPSGCGKSTTLRMIAGLEDISEGTVEIDGEVVRDFPATSLLEKAKPVLKVLPGWKCDIRGIKKYEDLPEACRNYVEFIEKELEVPIKMVSNGPRRDEIIYR